MVLETRPHVKGMGNMAYNGRIAIVGVAESDYGRVPHMTEMQLHAQATWRALEEIRKAREARLCKVDALPWVASCQ